jgi:predicted HTH transcriptional regulator
MRQSKKSSKPLEGVITEQTNSAFSVSELAPIFLLEKQESDRLKSRENGFLEFKESFNWESRLKYAKTMAAFANSRGGYIVFGVTDKPRTAKGLQSEKFENFDPAKISEILNEYFNPEINWEIGTHEFLNRKFGIIYVSSSENKPVICSKSASPERNTLPIQNLILDFDFQNI